MANITVSSSSNFDSAANLGLANGESITINTGAVLTMNSDNRWSQNAAVPLNISIDSSSGGELLMDGRDVWWVPFDASTGNVPALGTVGTPDVTRGGSNVGEFLGVFTALGVAPSASGGAMPASGFVKLRSKSTTLADNDVLTFAGGATITINSATGGQRGWLGITGAESGAMTVPRVGKWTIRGDWFELGTTSGSTGQTLQHYVADYCPAIWIETSAGSGVYEKWLCAGPRWSATYVSQDERGKFFGCDSAGVISLATATYGKLPASGCKVRVPNVHVGSAASANYAVNNLHATMATRWELTATASGYIDFEYAVFNGFLAASNSYYTTLAHCAVAERITLSNQSTPFDLTDVGVGILSVQSVAAADISSGSQSGGLLTECSMAVYSSATSLVTASSNVNDLVITGGRYTMFARNANSYIVSFGGRGLRVEDADILGSMIFGSGCFAPVVKNIRHSDTTVGAKITSSPQNAVQFVNGADAEVDGITLLPDGVPPYNSVVRINNVFGSPKVRNIGSPATPYDCDSHSDYLYQIQASPGLKMQRCYGVNTRTNIALLTNQVGLLQESCAGDYNDALPALASANTLKGISGGSTGFGGSGIPFTLSAIFGTHFYDTFTSATAGAIGLFFTEPLPSTAAYVSVSANVKFNAQGGAFLRVAGDELIYTWPHFILGYTGFANVALSLHGTNTGNLSYEYDLDKGSGFSGSYKTANAANLSAETGISATTGFKFKFRITCVTGSTSNVLDGLYVTGVTDATSQQTQYPLDTATVVVDGLVAGSRVKASKVSDGTVIFNGSEGSGTVAFDTEYIGAIEIDARKASSAPYYRPWTSRLTTVSGETVSATALQVLD